MILSIQPLNEEKYSNVSKTKLGACAAYYLYKHNIPLTYNYIGIAMYKMFPQVFSCDEEFAEFPSLDRINREIMHMTITNSKKENISRPSILLGDAKQGYQLTNYGIAIAEQILFEIQKSNAKPILHKTIDSHKQGLTKAYETLKKSTCYNDWKKTKILPKYTPWKLFGLMPFTQENKIKQNLSMAFEKAKELNDLEIQKFIKQVLLQLD